MVFPALFLVENIWYWILKIAYHVKNKECSKSIIYISMVLSLIWIIVHAFLNTNLVFWFELETALGMCLFFGLGLCIRSIDWKKSGFYIWFIKQRYNGVLVGVTVVFGVVVSVILTWINNWTDTRADYFSNVYLYITNAVIACAMVITISRCIYTNKLLEYIGKRTMAILVMHKFPIMFLKTLFPEVDAAILKGNVYVSIGMCVVTIWLCLIVEKIISKFLPEVFGRIRE